MRPEALDFLKTVLRFHTPLDPVYEFGSRQPHDYANVRPFFPDMKFVGCDIVPGPGVDEIRNIMGSGLKPRSVGTVICMETLEHVQDPFKAFAEVWRILKDGGLCIVTTVMNYEIHNAPGDYWRFTPGGLDLLFASQFKSHDVGWNGEPKFPIGVHGWGVK